MFFWIILALAAGVGLDRVVIWDKDRAVAREREYHIDTIGNLEKQLQVAKMDNYAMKRERGDSVDARDYVYENPHFESDFMRNGHAKTTLRRRQARQGA